MSANTSPIFGLVCVAKTAHLTAANTNRDGTGTIVDVVTAGSNGSRIDRVVAKAYGTTSAGLVTLYIYDGSTYFLVGELSISAVTPSATTASASTELVRTDGLPIATLPSGYKFSAATTVAQNINLTCYGADY